MPDIPSSVALQNIGGRINAGPHNTNYGPLQLAVNMLIAALSGGVVVDGVPVWNGTGLDFKRPFAKVYNVKDPLYGAKGDGATNDSVAIQAAIDAAAAAGGGEVYFPEGTYKCNVTLKAKVVLRGFTKARVDYAASATTLLQNAAGAVIDTPVGATDGCGVYDLRIQGLGAATAGKGIYFRNVNNGVVRRVAVNNVADEGVRQDAGIACIYEDIVAVNTVLNRARAAVIGAVDINGTDHWLSRIEATISGSIEGTKQSVNLYCVGIAVRMSTGWVSKCVGEISDVGIYVSGARNRFEGSRADLNYGHGFQVVGTSNQFSVCYALNNSQDTTNTYDGFNFTSASANNQTAGCSADSGTAKVHRYGVFDDVQSGSTKNQHVNPLSTGAATGAYRNSTNHGSMFLFAGGTPVPLAANSATPSVAGSQTFQTANSAPTTITSFAGGVDGQIIAVFCTDVNTTIQHNGAADGFILWGVGNKKLRQSAVYGFVRNGGVWYELETPPVGATADVGDAAKSIQARVDGETQVWNTPLTAPRAVTLSTTGAYTGAKFKIVRTAAATGASALNVGTGPLKALAVGQWCEVTYNGSAWVLTAFGSL